MNDGEIDYFLGSGASAQAGIPTGGTMVWEFNLHDALKLYATDKSVKIQFIEERSIDYYDQCKVMWGFSTSLYAKAAGVLWQPVTMNNDTAYVGLKQIRENHTTLGTAKANADVMLNRPQQRQSRRDRDAR